MRVFYFRSLLFHPDAACIYSVAGAFLNIYNWEPAKLCQSLDLSNVYKLSNVSESAGICDLAMSEKQLVSLRRIFAAYFLELTILLKTWQSNATTAV